MYNFYFFILWQLLVAACMKLFWLGLVGLLLW